MNQCFKNIKGFTLIEMILYMTLMSIIFGVVTYILFTEVDAYSVVTNRQTALGDIRYAMDRVSYEILRLRTGEITSISATELDFTDRDSQAASFRQAANGSAQAFYRGSDLLLSPISSLAFVYYDAAGTETAVIADIRRIKVTLTTAAIANEGDITVSQVIAPRSYGSNSIYENYQ